MINRLLRIEDRVIVTGNATKFGRGAATGGKVFSLIQLAEGDDNQDDITSVADVPYEADDETPVPPTALAATSTEAMGVVEDGALKAVKTVADGLKQVADAFKKPTPPPQAPPPTEEYIPPPPPPEESDDEPSPSISPSPSNKPMALEVNLIDGFGDGAMHFAQDHIAWYDREDIVGLMLQPPANVFPGFATVVEISGKLYCHDRLNQIKAANAGKSVPKSVDGDAPNSGILQWMLVHSMDGSNMQYRTLSQGEIEIRNGTFVGYGAYEGVTVFGMVPKFSAGGYVALWLTYRFSGERNPFAKRIRRSVVYDDLKWTFKKGSPLTFTGGVAAPQTASSGDCADCISDPAQEHVIDLPMMGRVKSL
jgi:hypothetical protein